MVFDGGLAEAPNLDPAGPIEVVYHDGRRWGFVASYSDAVALLIPGYLSIRSRSARLRARLMVAVQIRPALQARVSLPWLENCSDDEREVLCSADEAAPAVQQWNCAVPLVLVTTFYRRGGGLLPTPRPGGGPVWWIDPCCDLTLLASLNAAGWIGLRRHGTSFMRSFMAAAA